MTEIVQLYDVINWKKVMQPLVLKVLPAVTELLASGVVPDLPLLCDSIVSLYEALAVVVQRVCPMPKGDCEGTLARRAMFQQSPSHHHPFGGK